MIAGSSAGSTSASVFVLTSTQTPGVRSPTQGGASGVAPVVVPVASDDEPLSTPDDADVVPELAEVAGAMVVAEVIAVVSVAVPSPIVSDGPGVELSPQPVAAITNKLSDTRRFIE